LPYAWMRCDQRVRGLRLGKYLREKRHPAFPPNCSFYPSRICYNKGYQ
jgi:hypothetical protein